MVEELILSYLKYSPDTGDLIWLKTRGPKAIVGSTAGTNFRGYIRVQINKKSMLAHRIAWFLVHGYWPVEIDHINGVRNDNRLANLRASDRRHNMSNTCAHRKGKLVGTCYRKRDNKWHAQIKINGKSVHIGSFNTEEEAHSAYRARLLEIKTLGFAT